jgi:hypothetical protein
MIIKCGNCSDIISDAQQVADGVVEDGQKEGDYD